MSQTYYCDAHKERISDLSCSSCGKRLCRLCASFSTGKSFCPDCLAAERLKTGAAYTDHPEFYARQFTEKEIGRLTQKYLISAVFFFLLAGTVFFRAQLFSALDTYLGGAPIPLINIKADKLKSVLDPAAYFKAAKTAAANAAGTLASIQMQQFMGAIDAQFRETGAYPADLPSFLRTNFASEDKKRDPAKDMWGTEYRLETTANGFIIRSAGPDKKFGTSDDAIAEYSRK